MTTLARDTNSNVIQAYAIGEGQDLEFSTGASATSLALPGTCRLVRVLADEDIRVAVGPIGSVVAPATGGCWLNAGMEGHFRVPEGAGAMAVAVRGRDVGGTANIVACA